MIITTYNPTKANKPSFFIARVGSKAGCPIWKPYTVNNSFAVYSENPTKDFAAMKLAYDLGLMQMYVYGSCQPFIRLRDLSRIASELPKMTQKELDALSAIEAQKRLLAAQIEKLAEMEKAFQQSIYFKKCA